MASGGFLNPPPPPKKKKKKISLHIRRRHLLVFMGFTGFLLGFNWVWLGYTDFYQVELGLIVFLQGFHGFQWVQLVLLSFRGFFLIQVGF